MQTFRILYFNSPTLYNLEVGASTKMEHGLELLYESSEKFVALTSFSLPPYKSSSPSSVFVEAPTPKLYNMTCVGP